MPNQPSKPGPETGKQGDPLRQPAKPQQPASPGPGGHEVPAPPLRRTDTKEATMGKPGSAGKGAQPRDEGETQTQQTEFTSESDGADIDRASSSGKPGDAGAKGRQAEGGKSADQNRPADPGLGAQGGKSQEGTGSPPAL